MFALAGSAGAANVSPREVAFLAATQKKAGMMPNVVAHTLVAVEDEWQVKASLYNECKVQGTQEARTDCREAQDSFKASCAKVVHATLGGSSGDREDAKEYLDDVCGQNVLDQWHKDTCLSFTDAIASAMTQDSFENREHVDADNLCSGFWSNFLAKEAQRTEADAKAKAEREKIAAVAKAKAAAEAKVKADAEAKEAMAKAEAEAKVKAEEAAKAKAEADAKAKAQAEATAKAEKAKAEADSKAKAEAEAKASAEKEAKAKAEAEKEAKAKAAAEAKATANKEAKAKLVAAKAKDDEQAKAKAKAKAKA